LYSLIKHEHLRQGGEYLDYAADLALMFPVLEMAGHRVSWVREIVYVYNVKTPFQDYKQSVVQQHAIARHLRSLPKYRRLRASRLMQQVPVVKAWIEGCASITSSASDDIEATSSADCVRPLNSAQLTIQANGVWVPEEAVLLLQIFDADGILQAEEEIVEQQSSMQLRFNPGLYRPVISALPVELSDDEEVGRNRPLAAVTMSILLQ
jgi:hypothetical protein